MEKLLVEIYSCIPNRFDDLNNWFMEKGNRFSDSVNALIKAQMLVLKNRHELAEPILDNFPDVGSGIISIWYKVLLAEVNTALTGGIKTSQSINQARKAVVSLDSTLNQLLTTRLDYIEARFALNDSHILRAERNIKKLSTSSAYQKIVKKLWWECSQPFIIGEYHFISRVMKELLANGIDFIRIPNQDLLITGESGCGKEAIAQVLKMKLEKDHYENNVKTFPYKDINCAGDNTLFDKLFFGSKKGAYTDARKDESGYFDQANGGLLLLDEFGDLSIDNQTKFLRVMQERAFLPLGAKSEVSFTGRIIALTNANLSYKISQGLYRMDLLARFNNVLQIPSLNERKEEIIPLAQTFLISEAIAQNKIGLRFDDKALNYLENRKYPGNIRSLKNLVKSVVTALEDNETVTQLHLTHQEKYQVQFEDTPLANDTNKVEVNLENNRHILAEIVDNQPVPDLTNTLFYVEKSIIEELLRRNYYDITKTAKAVGKSYHGLKKSLERLGISIGSKDIN